MVWISMNADNSLTVSLEEFGLSRYEARAYFAMISRGPVSAGELAYYSDLPRTKVYPTLQKLQKKKLATISGTKPITCTAIAPEEAFDSIIQEQINKVNAMNSLISSLKKVNDESRRSRGIKERRYHHLAPGNVPSEMAAMIEGSHASVDVMAGGADTISCCRKQLVSAVRRGVTVRIIASVASVGSDRGDVVPGGAQVRMLDHDQNYMVVDGAGILVMDGAGGGDVVPASEGLRYGLAGSFRSEWGRALPAEPLLDLTGREATEIYRAVRILESDGMAAALEASADPKGAPDLAALLEGEGVDVHSKTISDLVEMAGYALKASCGGDGRLDTAGGVISLESGGRPSMALAWASVLDSYLRQRGYSTRQGMRDGRVHIRLEKR